MVANHVTTSQGSVDSDDTSCDDGVLDSDPADPDAE